MSIANLFEPNNYTLFAHEITTVIPQPPGPVPTTISVNAINDISSGIQINSATAAQPINITSNGQLNLNSASGTNIFGDLSHTGPTLFVGDFASSALIPADNFTVNTNNIILNVVNSIQYTVGGTISFNGSLLRNVADPLLAQDAATKNYVDTAIVPGTTQTFNANLNTPSGPLVASCDVFKDSLGVVHMIISQIGPLVAALGVNVESGFDIPVGFRPTNIEEYNFIIAVTNNSSEVTGKIIIRADGSFTIKLSTGLPFTGANFWGVNRTAVSWV